MLFRLRIINPNNLLRFCSNLLLRFAHFNFTRQTCSDRPRKRRNFAPSIPDELLAEIFKRMPAEIIGRSMCVCKSWKSLLSSSYFVELHYRHSPATQKPCLVLNQKPIKIGTLCSLSSPSIRLRTQNHSTTNPLFVSAINGVVCLTTSDQSTLVLWNPVIRKYVVIPDFPKIEDDAYPERYALGFGFNDSTQDFSVIRVWMPAQDRKPLRYDVFSSKAGAWRTTAENDFIRPSKVLSNGSFCKGVIIWLIEPLDDINECSFLMFDCQGEKFTRFNLQNLRLMTVLNDHQVIIPSSSKGGLLLMDHALAQPVSLADKNHEYLLI